MKKLALLLSLAVVSLGLSSCCSMFSFPNITAGSYEKTYEAKSCGYDIVRTEKVVDAKQGLVEVVETKVPRTTTKTKKVWISCPKCTRYYCNKDGCCGSSTKAARKMATAQFSGSPHIGLIPTMKSIVE